MTAAASERTISIASLMSRVMLPSGGCQVRDSQTTTVDRGEGHVIHLARTTLFLRCARTLHVARDARIPPRQAPSTYVNNANNLIKGTEYEGKSLEDVVTGSFGKNAALFNNVGQHYNHIHFWKWMKAGGGGDKIPGNLEEKIVSDLESVAKMKESFIQAGITQFGSGWCWLAVKDGRIVVAKTANGESPLVHGAQPILGCDVWEHSYYIDYRNRRPDY